MLDLLDDDVVYLSIMKDDRCFPRHASSRETRSRHANSEQIKEPSLSGFLVPRIRLKLKINLRGVSGS